MLLISTVSRELSAGVVVGDGSWKSGVKRCETLSEHLLSPRIITSANFPLAEECITISSTCVDVLLNCEATSR